MKNAIWGMLAVVVGLGGCAKGTCDLAEFSEGTHTFEMDPEDFPSCTVDWGIVVDVASDGTPTVRPRTHVWVENGEIVTYDAYCSFHPVCSGEIVVYCDTPNGLEYEVTISPGLDTATVALLDANGEELCSTRMLVDYSEGAQP